MVFHVHVDCADNAMWSARVLLALLASASLIMVAAGFYLNRRRRRYRAVIMAKSSYLDIPTTPVSGSKSCRNLHYFMFPCILLLKLPIVDFRYSESL